MNVIKYNVNDLTLKGPIRTAADEISVISLLAFHKNKV